MGKHATLAQKVAFLVHLEYVPCAEAARKADIPWLQQTQKLGQEHYVLSALKLGYLFLLMKGKWLGSQEVEHQ